MKRRVLLALAVALLAGHAKAMSAPETTSRRGYAQRNAATLVAPVLYKRHMEHLGDKPTSSSGSVGLFDPLRVMLSDKLELSTHPLLFLALAPNAKLRVVHAHHGAWTATGEYGLALPTGLLRLTKGNLFPTWDFSSSNVGWTVVPTLGLAVTRQIDRHDDPFVAPDAFTLRMNVAPGLRLSRNEATDLDTVAPLWLALAPVTNQFRLSFEAQYDLALTERVHFRPSVALHVVGASSAPRKSPVLFEANAVFDFNLSEHWQLTAGATFYDYDQRKSVVTIGSDGFATRERVRSRELWPNLDLIYRF
jgi:hypothetical protein